METNQRLWHSMESLPTLAALLPEWEFALGDHFAQATPFLTPTDLQPEIYPCPQDDPCGCQHLISFHSLDDIEARCQCGNCGCESIQLHPADLIVYAFDMPRLAAAISAPAGFDLSIVTRHGPRTWQLASWGGRRTPVVFYSPIALGDLLNEIERLAAVVGGPFILLTPTSHRCTPVVQGMLNRQGCVHLSLADTLTVAADGQFHLAHPLQPLLESIGAAQIQTNVALQKTMTRIDRKLETIAKNAASIAQPSTLNPQPVEEDTARQLFALVKQLETESSWRKAPVLQVFRLYCMEGLTGKQIAKRCACAKSLIILRLKQLREKLGRDPAELRQYSDHFDRIEDSLNDPRAKKIRRRTVDYDDSEDEND